MESLGIQIKLITMRWQQPVAEIDMRFTKLTRMADNLMLYKYVIKNTARKHSMTATFMPKPLFEDNASGMHVHQSLWKNNTNLFHTDGHYANLSDLARHYIGGLLKHAWALCAFCAPTTNSYRRLVPGYEAPINLVYSQRNRSACCRIPMYSPNPRAKRVEFRTPDPSCNGYLAFAAMLMAGLDGIDKRTDPGKPIDKNLYDLPPAEAKVVKSTPGSPQQALDALEADHAFLPAVMCSPRMSLKPGSATSGKKRLMPSRCVPILMSSTFISTVSSTTRPPHRREAMNSRTGLPPEA
jgi:glutamine synthetase